MKLAKQKQITIISNKWVIVFNKMQNERSINIWGVKKFVYILGNKFTSFFLSYKSLLITLPIKLTTQTKNKKIKTELNSSKHNNKIITNKKHNWQTL